MEKLNNNKEITVVTVTLECNGNESPANNCRYEILKKVVEKYGKEDIILFPGRFFRIQDFGSKEETKTVNDVSRLLTEMNSESIVCLGIDAGNGKDIDKLNPGNNAVHNDQIAVAINNSGILAKGRKFYPKETEKGKINLAKSFNCKESGYERFFKCKGKQFYLAVCYDICGIRKEKIKSGTGVQIDAILNTAHFFTPPKKEGSGYDHFIREEYGGASLRWDCPVFASVIFFGRKVPAKWQPGFLCEKRQQILNDLTRIKYSDNLWEHNNKPNCMIKTNYENAVCYLYTI
jgi:hypothetical protein